MTTPTSNSVPSNQPADLLFNAEKNDEFINGTALTFFDRFGNERLTAKGITAAADQRIDDSMVTIDSAVATVTDGVEAASDAADTAEALANRWATKELGVANTADGRYFSTPSVVVGEASIIWQRTGSTATDTGKRTPSTELVFKVLPIESGYLLSIETPSRRQLAAFRVDGTFVPAKMQLPSGAVSSAALVPGAVTAAALGAGAVTAPAMGAASVNAASLAPEAVTPAKLSAELAGLVFKALPTESGYLLSIETTSRRQLAAFALDGTFVPSKMRLPAGAVQTGAIAAGVVDTATLASDVTARLLPVGRQKYVAEVTGATPNRALYLSDLQTGKRLLVSSTGDPNNPRITLDDKVIFDTTTLTTFFDPATGLTNRAFPQRRIAVFGDSHTTFNFPERMATVLGITVVKRGKGSWASSDVAMRQGGLRVKVTAAGNQIPASGPVALTLTDPTTSFLFNGSVAAPAWVGTLVGVPGTLTHNQDPGNNWTFTRTTAGSVVACPPSSEFASTEFDGDLTSALVVMMGRNNYYSGNDTTFAAVPRDFDLMVANLKTYEKRWLLLGITNGAGEGTGTAIHTAITARNAASAAKYGDRFIDIRRLLIDNALTILAGAGITPTSQDLADIANDIPPASLRVDAIHFTEAAYNFIGDTAAAKYNFFGWAL